MKNILITSIFLLASPLHAATVDPEFVRFQGDPEAFVTGYNSKGMPFFHKRGPYLGPLKGELPCARIARKDMKHDRVEPVCKPKPRFVDTPDFVRPPMRVVGGSYPEGWRHRGYPLSAGTWLAGHADGGRWYGDTFHSSSDYQIEYVSYFETTTITVEGCGCKHESETLPPIVPLPSSLLLLSALGFTLFHKKEPSS